MKHLAGLKLSPEQHQQLVDICDSPATFPSTYQEWLAIVHKGEAEALRAGETMSAVEIELGDFVRWCRTVGLVPCTDSLKAYAIVQRLTSANASPDRAHGSGRTS